MTERLPTCRQSDSPNVWIESLLTQVYRLQIAPGQGETRSSYYALTRNGSRSAEEKEQLNPSSRRTNNMELLIIKKSILVFLPIF